MAYNNQVRRDKIIVRGARVNNLKNINVDIPRDKLVVITGLSGSGKSSLAFDTIYAEGNRRYMEGLSSYARNFLDVSVKPDIDKIENLSPTISIDQKSISRSPRSTVGTLTEIYDYLRLLFSKLGIPHCPECGARMSRKSVKEIVEIITGLPNNSRVIIMANPAGKDKSNSQLLRQIQHSGHARVRFNNQIMSVSEALLIVSDLVPVDIKIVIDRLLLDKTNPDRERIADSIESAFKAGDGSVVIEANNEEKSYNQDFVCASCNIKIKEITPRHFSFNNPEGACPKCSGLGYTQIISPDLVIPNKNLTLAEGAIQPWSKAGGKTNSQSNYFSVFKLLEEKFGISSNVPVKNLSEEQLEVLLYGRRKQNLKINSSEEVNVKSNFFEGIIPSLHKKYLETKSDFVRNEIERYMISKTCPVCEGKRLKKEFLSVTIENKSIDYVVRLNVSELRKLLAGFESWRLEEKDKKIGRGIIREIDERLKSLENVGLEYLNMARSAESISGGEAQRIRLAVQLNSKLMGITYVLDEPSMGLHCRDAEKLIQTISLLRHTGNSIIIVEHDEKIIRSADWIIDMGPGAGEEGGEIVFQGTLEKLLKAKTLTAEYLAGSKAVTNKKKYRLERTSNIEIIKAQENNLKGINVKIPLEKFTVVCGVSGSGKSTLVNDILSRALAKHFYKAKVEPGKYKKIKGLDKVDKVISIDQSPIGKTPRSNAATYTGIFSHIRDLFAQTEEARSRGYQASQFSFNMKGGRCEVCQGDGMQKIEMHLLPDIYVKCESCGGTRFNKKTLEIEYKGKNIAQVLDMDVHFAMHFFYDQQLIYEKLRVMEEVGLGYLKLGQSATNLSGGEAQRIKLSTELSRKSTGKTLYILDEPTVGLHFDDTRRLLQVLETLVNKGNSVLVVEHNLDVIRNADWGIELGPEGGEKGGYIVFEGTPHNLKKCKKSWTAKYL